MVWGVYRASQLSIVQEKKGNSRKHLQLIKLAQTCQKSGQTESVDALVISPSVSNNKVAGDTDMRGLLN